MATEPAQKKPKTSTGNGRLANKVILITAAAQGIGRASAIVSFEAPFSISATKPSIDPYLTCYVGLC